LTWKRTPEADLKTISMTWEGAKRAAKTGKMKTSSQGPMLQRDDEKLKEGDIYCNSGLTAY